MNIHVKKLAGQTAIYGFSTIVGRLFNYLLTPLYTRVFLPAQYGVITEMYAYVSVLNVLYTMGMETAFFRYFSIKENKKDVFNTAFTALFVSTILLSFLLWLATPYIAHITKYSDHPEYIYMFLGIMAFDTLTAIPFALLRVQNKPRLFATVKLLNIGTNLVFNLLFLMLLPFLSNHSIYKSSVLQIYNPAFGVGYVFISNLLASVITLLYFYKSLINISFKINRSLLKEMLYYGLPLIIVGLAGMVNETMDRLLLKFNLPGTSNYIMSQVGIYGANYRLSILLTLFVQAFKMAAEPFFFNQAKDKDAPHQYAAIMNYFVVFTCGIFLLVTLYLPVFKIFIGSKYYSGLHVVPILLLANLFLGVYYNLSIWYKLTHNNQMGARVAIIGAIITLTINLVFIPRFSYDASAWATFICYGSMMLISYWQSRKYFPVPYNLKFIGIVFIASLVLFALINMVYVNNKSGTLITLLFGSLGMGVYTFLVYSLFKSRKLFPAPAGLI